LFKREFDFYLYGHTHKLQASLNDTFYGKIYYNNACATLADFNLNGTYVNGYNVIEYKINESIKVTYRKYNRDKNKFITYSEAGNQEGYSIIPIPSIAKQTENFEVLDIIDTLAKSKVDSLDEHLIIYNTDSDAPCTLKKVFVAPTITNYPNPNAVDSDELIKYSVIDIIKNESNFLIFGTKESGKTILLDRIFIEYLENSNTNYIPVLINFKEIGNKQMASVLKEFLNKSTSEVNKLLAKQKIVLIVDDISFDEKFKHIIKKIKNFLKEYRVKTICTSTIINLRDFPTDFLDNNIGFDFETGFIQNLSGKQIKTLITKWFGGKEVDYQDKLEQLLKNFFELALPRNPLTVSLFLWIIETQEKKPVNNASLVKLFVENLLEKANFENIYSETFSFENKQRLLAAIAKYMIDKGDGDLSYQLKYHKLLTFITEYFESRFKVDPSKILSVFINRGILVEKEEFVKFKAPFLFHYFLACKMVYDKEFKKHILNKENFLNFADEIEYYAGITLSDEELLSFLLKQLQETFNPINNKIRQDYTVIDEFLDSKDYLSSSVKMKKIKKITDDELDEIYNDQFEELPVKNQIQNKAKSATKEDLGRLLKLAAVVLKNSEEIDDIGIKKLAYDTIILSSQSYLLFSKISLLEYFYENRKVPTSFPKNINFRLFIKVLPLIHQVMLTDWIGTPKLGIAIDQLLNEYNQSANISDYEKFISIFIYSDVRSSNYTSLLKSVTKVFDKNYILDLCFLKLLTYYHMRSKDKTSDEFYLNLLADIKVKMGHMSKQQKSKFMIKLRNERQLKLFDQKHKEKR